LDVTRPHLVARLEAKPALAGGVCTPGRGASDMTF